MEQTPTPQTGALPPYVVSSIALSWADVAAGHFPRKAPTPPPPGFDDSLADWPAETPAAPTARQAWRQAVAAVAQQAKEGLPQHRGRIDKAVQLVLADDVRAGEGGQYTVGSASEPGLQYVVGDECACKDAARPAVQGWCKHKLAVEVLKQARAQLEAQHQQAAVERSFQQTITEGPTMMSSTTPVLEDLSAAGVQRSLPTPPVPPTALTLSGAVMTESPYSLNVRVAKHDFVFQLTVRKSDRDELLDAMNGLPAWLESHGFRPAEARHHAAHGPEDTPAQTEAPSCRYHGMQAMSASKFGGYKCDVRLADGSFCNQKWPLKAKA